jgi:hypothetical protein
MKIGMIKYFAGFTVAIAACASFAATVEKDGSGQIGSAQLFQTTYRNMNMPIIRCQVSAETRNATLASGNSIAEELTLILDFEDAMVMQTTKNFKAKGFIVDSDKKVGSQISSSGIGSLLTGTVTVNQKNADIVFKSDVIRYNEKYVMTRVITFSKEMTLATISTINSSNSSVSTDGTYDCKGFAE